MIFVLFNLCCEEFFVKTDDFIQYVEFEILTNLNVNNTVLLNNNFQFYRKAKELIDHIINNIVTVSLPVSLTVENLLNRHGNKIKTIEVGTISEVFVFLKNLCLFISL